MMPSDALLKIVFDRLLPSGGVPPFPSGAEDTRTTSRVLEVVLDVAPALHDTIKNRTAAFLYASLQADGHWQMVNRKSDNGENAYLLQLLLRSGYSIVDEKLSQCWVEILKLKHQDGAFLQSSTVMRTHIAAQANVVRLLSCLDKSYQNLKEEALQWLQGVQNKDGGFGPYLGTVSDVLMTCAVADAVFDYPNFFQGNLGQKAIMSILDTQRADGSWQLTGRNYDKVELTAYALHVLKKTHTQGIPVRKAASFLNDFLQRSNWDQLPSLQLILIARALYSH